MYPKKPKAAVIQMVSCGAVGPNLIQAKSFIQKAADQGAELVILPENFAYFPQNLNSNLNSNCESYANSLTCIAETLGEGRIQEWAARISQELNIFLVAGSVPIYIKNKIKSCALLFNSKGERLAHYEQVHLLGFNSQHYVPGEDPLVIKTPFGNLGFALGDDLRFPGLFLKLRELGAEMICIPASFTRAQGLNHWKPLLLARAIENQCYILAANQGGLHDNQCETYGTSMVINPMGLIQAQIDRGPGLALGEIDLLQLQILREDFSIFEHVKKF